MKGIPGKLFLDDSDGNSDDNTRKWMEKGSGKDNNNNNCLQTCRNGERDLRSVCAGWGLGAAARVADCSSPGGLVGLGGGRFAGVAGVRVADSSFPGGVVGPGGGRPLSAQPGRGCSVSFIVAIVVVLPIVSRQFRWRWFNFTQPLTSGPVDEQLDARPSSAELQPAGTLENAWEGFQ